MSIDKYRVSGWQMMNNEQQPHVLDSDALVIDVDVVVLALVVISVTFIVAFLLGYSDGLGDSQRLCEMRP